MEPAHLCMPLVPGRCQARCFSHTSCKGKQSPQLAVGLLERSNTPRFHECSPGNVPAGAEAFPGALFDAAARPPPVHPMVSWLRTANSGDNWNNAEAFLRAALRRTTRTLESPFKVLYIYSHTRGQKWKRQGLKPCEEPAASHATRSGVACGGFRSVN